MACKDCVHYDVCYLLDWGGKPCEHYKNKADFVEIVRCKDCKEYDVRNGECRLHSFHPVYGEHFEVEMYGNDFCSYGERKEKDNVRTAD